MLFTMLFLLCCAAPSSDSSPAGEVGGVSYLCDSGSVVIEPEGYPLVLACSAGDCRPDTSWVIRDGSLMISCQIGASVVVTWI